RPSVRPSLRSWLLILEVLRRRIVACVHGVGQERFLLVSPELADAGIGLDDRVDELTTLPLAAADEDIADDVAVLVELDWAPRSVGERYFVQGLGERLSVVRFLAQGQHGCLQTLAGYVHAG